MVSIYSVINSFGLTFSGSLDRVFTVHMQPKHGHAHDNGIGHNGVSLR